VTLPVPAVSVLSPRTFSAIVPYHRSESCLPRNGRGSLADTGPSDVLIFASDGSGLCRPMNSPNYSSVIPISDRALHAPLASPEMYPQEVHLIGSYLP
jgi:hypothetical protein